jgi:hypothetical protein
VGSEDSDDLWRKVQDLAKLGVLFPDFVFRPFAIFNVEINSEPIQGGPVRSPNRLGTTEEPPVTSSGVTHTKSRLTGGART